jgi:hypothetical protein
MSKFLTIAAVVLLGSSAVPTLAATPRYSSLKYSCDAIQSLIDKHGAAIFRYPSPRKPQLTLYDRYVRNINFCMSYQMTESVFIPSADTDQCLVEHCITRDCDDYRRFCY